MRFSQKCGLLKPVWTVKPVLKTSSVRFIMLEAPEVTSSKEWNISIIRDSEKNISNQIHERELSLYLPISWIFVPICSWRSNAHLRKWCKRRSALDTSTQCQKAGHLLRTGKKTHVCRKCCLGGDKVSYRIICAQHR